jgi:hypothetical protein
VVPDSAPQCRLGASDPGDVPVPLRIAISLTLFSLLALAVPALSLAQEPPAPDPTPWDGGWQHDGGGGGGWTPPVPQLPRVSTPTVAGKVAMLRKDGKAAIPRSAPARVRAVIAAANRIIGKPYKWGGGHAKLFDRGYDCSGSVSFALIVGGRLASPLVSGSFARWGLAGAGRWATIYANSTHVYMEIAGLRLDTSSVGDWGGKSGVRWRPLIGKRPGFRVRHPLGF